MNPVFSHFVLSKKSWNRQGVPTVQDVELERKCLFCCFGSKNLNWVPIQTHCWDEALAIPTVLLTAIGVAFGHLYFSGVLAAPKACSYRIAPILRDWQKNCWCCVVCWFVSTCILNSRSLCLWETSRRKITTQLATIKTVWSLDWCAGQRGTMYFSF